MKGRQKEGAVGKNIPVIRANESFAPNPHFTDEGTKAHEGKSPQLFRGGDVIGPQALLAPPLEFPVRLGQIKGCLESSLERGGPLSAEWSH